MRKLLVSVCSVGLLALSAAPALAADKNDNDSKMKPPPGNYPSVVGPHTDDRKAVQIIEERLGQRPNGVWGDELSKALARFQENHDGLTKDRTVGRRTLAALRGREDLPPNGPLTDRQAWWLGLEPKPIKPAVPAGTAAPVVDESEAYVPETTETTVPETTGAPSGQLGSIASCESGGDYSAVDPSGTYGGAYQFDQSTWESVGGSGSPASAPPGEQDKRAQMLLQQSGTSPWPNCG